MTSSEGGRIATAESDTVVRVYCGRNGERPARHAGFLLETLSAAFLADGRQLLAAGADKFNAALDMSAGRAIVKSAAMAISLVSLAPFD